MNVGVPQGAFLETAIEAARNAEAIIRHYYRSGAQISIKPDQTPVTVADVETERAIKTTLRQAFPDHGFFGEETGRDQPEAEYTWLVDPIDGTKSFVRKNPFFSTQIALMKGNTFVLGVSNAPMFNELACAERGTGAFLNREPLRVSDIRDISAATLSFGNIKTLAGDGRWLKLAALIRRVNRTRGYGDFYHYHLLAAGKIDLVIESDVNILDIAALSVIIQEAGGRMTDLEGKPLTLGTTSVLASNDQLHEQILELLNA